MQKPFMQMPTLHSHAGRCCQRQTLGNREHCSFRGKLLMLMLLNYCCYLSFCDVWLSLNVYCELSWQPVNAQQVCIYQCCACVDVSGALPRQQLPAALMLSLHRHWGRVSGNHLGDLILPTGLSPGETVETHPNWCRMTRCPSKKSNLQR